MNSNLFPYQMIEMIHRPEVQDYLSDLFNSKERLGFSLYSIISIILNYLSIRVEIELINVDPQNQYQYQQGSSTFLQNFQLLEQREVKMSYQDWLMTLLNVSTDFFLLFYTILGRVGIGANLLISHIYIRDPNEFNQSGRFELFTQNVLIAFKYLSLFLNTGMMISVICNLMLSLLTGQFQIIKKYVLIFVPSTVLLFALNYVPDVMAIKYLSKVMI
ncbi:UNKNOWN [Stylonychia lemnae]|uniref:Uncharacterized protein n=1 Tax=Stylonychia lemnae TaxID=5949 RepID=A0A077ZZ09_STYLE|nr:UNKNOWN [Stylonychia lemnae]|eukprot:CDW75155.1 UNKNOWN [Stylonychia lemnae]